MSDIISLEWYTALVEDCEAILVEKSYEHRWALIEMYFMLGQRLREEADKMPMSKLVSKVSKDLNVHERNLWYSVQAYDKFGTPDKLPEGKNMSWSKVRELLPASKKRTENLFDPRKVAQGIVDRYGVDLAKKIHKKLGTILSDFE